MRRLGASTLCAAALALTVLCQTAGADVFGQISLVSESATQQVEYAHDPAISGNGGYVAFDGSFGGITGVWRRDLASGVVEPVAVGESETPAGSAELPSISADGRFVSFTTTATLAPGDHNSAPDVYVRDMSISAEQPGAFVLASAVGGSEEALTYQPTGKGELHFEETHYGSFASGRSALSADGSKVAFVTTAISNLDGPGTPALQVAVRDLGSQETQLVSVAYPAQSGPVSGVEGSRTLGAVYAEGGVPPAFRSPGAYGAGDPPSVGASISADGSTVAWMGQNIGEQVPLLAQETVRAVYTEPLWRRIANGPSAPTRRIAGGSDPTSPACAASGETALPGTASLSDPCQGPFAVSPPGIWAGAAGNPVPQLSADGSKVAFLATAPLVSLGGDFGSDSENRPSDIYVVNMAEGLTRVQALQPLSELASGDITDLATTGPIVDLSISADGSQVAFSTKRTVFPLGTPAYVSAPAAVPGMVELFEVDLDDETLTRVTQGYEGGPSEHPHEAQPPGQDPYGNPADGALSPSFSDDGITLAFSSTASNLAYGDGNTPNHNSLTFDGSDGFLVSRKLFAATATEGYVTGAPENPTPVPDWRLGSTVLSRRDGTVVLEVQVPAAGTLRVDASAAVPARGVGLARTGRARARHARVRATVVTRGVASSVTHTSAAGLTTVTLKLAPHYAALAGEAGGLSADATVLFTVAGQPTLHESVDVSFVRKATTARRSRGGRVARRHGRARRPHR